MNKEQAIELRLQTVQLALQDGARDGDVITAAAKIYTYITQGGDAFANAKIAPPPTLWPPGISGELPARPY